jgi:hypothetical protein
MLMNRQAINEESVLAYPVVQVISVTHTSTAAMRKHQGIKSRLGCVKHVTYLAEQSATPPAGL